MTDRDVTRARENFSWSLRGPADKAWVQKEDVRNILAALDTALARVAELEAREERWLAAGMLPLDIAEEVARRVDQRLAWRWHRSSSEHDFGALACNLCMTGCVAVDLETGVLTCLNCGATAPEGTPPTPLSQT